jgi:hypothetical protein
LENLKSWVIVFVGEKAEVVEEFTNWEPFNNWGTLIL